MRMEHIYQFQHWLFFIVLGMFLSLALSVKANELEGSSDERGIALSTRTFISISKNRTALSRKLLLSPDIGDGTNRIGQDCSKDDIVLFQGTTNPLPSGVPAYTVEIFNACVSECNIAEIHVSCGWFSSVRLVNPRVFRRLCYDDCLVNDGQPLGPGQTLSFQYANSFSYPLSVSSVSCF
ncbi:PREDICTED: TPD1 protein homolog 1 [Camelina sativa]|uniref:TPD1 protein homolog 1 n=1 Tax=Camelina sativa TaxID=90675 RepID=A0ABM0YER4_CAMSA|nr:PREDICTED: TPD1 protein homolog 1 [Camelina sativa]XP_010499836.1 PREDICTED: TPD1 protein homolog 1 [Camelina sativa]XP_010499837.1 PREDICTED: TPD1 protein homolog 1 [Camelina sativa]